MIDAIKNYLEIREEPISPEGKMTYSGRTIKGYIIDNYGKKLYHRDAVFLNGYGGRLRKRAMGDMMKKYAAQAGITKKIFCHLWRASGITIADSNGVSLNQIMKRSGHTNIQSVMPYMNPNKNETNMKISNALEIKKSLTKPTIEPPKQKINNSIHKDLELKLIKQLANVEISTKVYNDAMGRLKDITNPTIDIEGYQ